MELNDHLREGTLVFCLGCGADIARLRRDARFGEAVVEDLFEWSGRRFHNGELAKCDCGALWLTAWLRALKAAHRWSCGCLVCERLTDDGPLLEYVMLPSGGVVMEGCNSRAPGTTPTNLSLHETGKPWWRPDAVQPDTDGIVLPTRIRTTVAVNGEIVQRAEVTRGPNGFSYALPEGVELERGELATITMRWESGGRAELEFPSPYRLKLDVLSDHPFGVGGYS